MKLEELDIWAECMNANVLDMLTAAFQKGGLPCLRRLTFSGSAQAEHYDFPWDWRDLGPVIKLEYLKLELPLPCGGAFSEALADPGFWPFLRAALGWLDEERLEERLVLREEAAQSGREPARPLSVVEQVELRAHNFELERRNQELEARVRELEAQLEAEPPRQRQRAQR